MKVLIAESNYPDDFYKGKLDGISTSHILNTLGIENTLKYALNFRNFKKSIEECASTGCNVFHLSCHGDEDGIALTDNYQPTWGEFADSFQDHIQTPTAIIISSCCGAAKGISKAFIDKKYKPKIIFGSTTPLSHSKYITAWSILY